MSSAVAPLVDKASPFGMRGVADFDIDDEDHYASIRPRAEDGKTKQIITLKAILRRSVFFAAKVAESDDAAQAGINCWAQTWPIHIDSKYKVVRQYIRFLENPSVIRTADRSAFVKTNTPDGRSERLRELVQVELKHLFECYYFADFVNDKNFVNGLKCSIADLCTSHEIMPTDFVVEVMQNVPHDKVMQLFVLRLACLPAPKEERVTVALKITEASGFLELDHFSRLWILRTLNQSGDSNYHWSGYFTPGEAFLGSWSSDESLLFYVPTYLVPTDTKGESQELVDFASHSAPFSNATIQRHRDESAIARIIKNRLI